jgi:hypothetical protein
VLLGHAKLDTTALYTRVANTTIRSVTSPLDRLAPLAVGRSSPGGLCHGNDRWAREGRGLSLTSCCCDSIVPLRRRVGSKDPQGRSGDEVALKVECVMDGGVHIEKALG